jgi:tetraacyldisaccharide 4'-kinase
MNLYSRLVETYIRHRHRIFDSGKKKIRRIDTSILSTGSLTLGGAGKSPLTHFIAKLLISQGVSPAILSRGYGRQSQGMQEVHLSGNLSKDAQHFGDEPVMLKSLLPHVPVVVSADRYTGARFLEQRYQPRVIVLDDGFQHRRLHHDLDILIFKKDFKGKNASYFPFGDLRDSLSRLEEADFIFLETGAIQEVSNFLSSQATVIPYKLTYTLDKPVLQKGPICAFCGIARPDRFQETLHMLNIHPRTFIPFRDHVVYTASHLKRLIQTDCKIFITTQKDAVKLPESFLKTHDIYLVIMDIVPDIPVDKQILHHLKLS